MKKSAIVFNGKLIKVYNGMEQLPDKRSMYMEKVSHPGAALMVPFKRGDIVLIRQYRAVIRENIWELPAGLFSGNEKPIECAKRELREETGYIAGKTEKLGVIYTSPGFCDEKIHVYRTECAEKKPVSRDEHEIMTVKTFSSKDLKSMLKNGKITDSKTISALALSGIF